MASPVYILLITALHYCRSTVLHCDFDSGTKGDTYLPCECSGRSCSLQQATDDQFDWTVHQGSTLSAATGPDDDHTRADGTGLYIYTEISRVPNNSTAEIRTPPLSLSVTSCLTFWYHMKGYSIGDLSVLATYSDGTSSMLWQRSGQQADTWMSAHVSLSRIISELTFRMTHNRIGSFGDIALDDIVIKEELCPGSADMATESRPDPVITTGANTAASPVTTSITKTLPTSPPTTAQSQYTPSERTNSENADTPSTFASTVNKPQSTTGLPNNIALGQPTNQTGTLSDRTSDLAVDGRFGYPSGNEDYCALIQNRVPDEMAEWWVDLETVYTVHTITVHNTYYEWAYVRLTDFTLGVLSPGRPEVSCGHHPDTVGRGQSVTLTCPPDAVGQYVHFSRLGGGPDPYRVSLCEVQVTGTQYDGCLSPFYGQNCETRCGSCVTSGLYNPCDVSGVCTKGCMHWWLGDRCTTEIALADFTTQTVSRGAATSDSITIDWEQIDVPAALIGYYGYTVFYQSTTDAVTGLTHVPQTSSRTLTVTLSDLTFNTEYNIEVRPYRQRGGVTEYGRYYPAQTYRTACKAPVPPDVSVSHIYTSSMIVVIVVVYTLPSDTGCDALTKLWVEYRLTGSSTWSSRDASIWATSLTLEPGVTGTYEVRMTVRNNGDLEASTGIYRIDVEDIATPRMTPTREQTAAGSTVLFYPTTATQCTPCTISWGLLGAALAVMLVSITINVMLCVKNRRTSSTDHHPTEHHYENKGVADAGKTSKDPKPQPEVRKPALGDVTEYEAVDVGPSSVVHSPATGPLYANSGQGQRSDYDNIPSDEPMSTDTSQTTEGQGHYERMQQVRELPPNPYDVMA